MINLNLLPPEINKELDFAKKNAKLTHKLFVAIAIFLGIAALISVLAFVLYTEKAEADRQKVIAQQQINTQNEQLGKANNLYKRLTLFTKISKASTDWSKIFKELADVTPNNVEIDSFSVGAINTRAKITGIAVDDASVVSLKENMAKSKLFSYVDLENISVGSDPKGENRVFRSYSISFLINQNEAKK